MVNLEKGSVLIVGGGEVAYRKATKLLSFGAHVTIISKRFNSKIEGLPIEKVKLDVIDQGLLDGLISKKLFVIAATDDQRINDLVEERCNELGVFCNVVDRKSSSIIFPAAQRDGELIISVSTSGEVPFFSAYLANKIMAYLMGYVDTFKILKGMRPSLLTMDHRRRSSFFKKILDDDNFWRIVNSGDNEELNRYLDDFLGKYK